MKEVSVGEEEGAPNIGDAVISKQGKSSKYVCDLYDSKRVINIRNMEVFNRRWIFIEEIYSSVLFFDIEDNNIGSTGYNYFTHITMKGL